MGDYVDLPALLRVAAVSLAGGVGLVALFAVTVRYASQASEEHRADSALVAVVSLAIVLVGVAVVLYVLILA